MLHVQQIGRPKQASPTKASRFALSLHVACQPAKCPTFLAVAVLFRSCGIDVPYPTFIHSLRHCRDGETDRGSRKRPRKSCRPKRNVRLQQPCVKNWTWQLHSKKAKVARTLKKNEKSGLQVRR